MAAALKDFFSQTLVLHIGRSLQASSSQFPIKPFVNDASQNLQNLELLERAHTIKAAMRKHLPASYREALAIIVSSLAAPRPQELEGNAMASFFYLPHVLFVAEYGLDDFDLSLAAQVELTKRFTAEFSIRTFIEADMHRTLAFLTMLARSADPNVRRLASEGTRLRLPWAKRVPSLEREPGRIVKILNLLRDDDSEMVRRSVANNLNDLSRVDPNLMLDVVEKWLQGADKNRRRLIEHALRTLVKKGNPRALGLLGFGRKPSIEVCEVTFSPKRVAIGASTRVRFTVHSSRNSPQDLLVDLEIAFIKASGQPSPKVFKLGKVTLNAGESAVLAKAISLKVHTTRKPYAGKHTVTALVNGCRYDLGHFVVV